MSVSFKKTITTALLSTGLGSGFLCAQTGLFEADLITVNSTFSGGGFTSVNFRQTFDETPLVFVLSTTQGSDPSILRIRDVTTTGFEIAPIEPVGNDGPHIAMTNVTYLAIEAGRHEIQSGVFLDAGRFRTNTTVQSTIFGSGGGYETVDFREAYANAPAVLATIQTMNNENNTLPSSPSSPWLTASVNNIGTDQFDISLERSETNDGSTVDLDETIGYLALQSTTGSFTDSGGANVLWDAFISSNTVSSGSTTTAFNQTFSSNPLAVATKATRNGGDGGWVRQNALSSTGIGLIVDEDIFNDSERNHTNEQASIAAFSQAFDVRNNLSNTTITWLGDVSSAWNENGNWANWTGDDYNLIEGDILLFNDQGSGQTNTFVTDAYATEIAGILFEESTAYTLNAGGGSLVFQDGGGIANDSDEQQTLSVALEARGSDFIIDSGSASGGVACFGCKRYS